MPNLLLDACALIWLAEGANCLSKEVVECGRFRNFRCFSLHPLPWCGIMVSSCP